MSHSKAGKGHLKRHLCTGPESKGLSVAGRAWGPRRLTPLEESIKGKTGAGKLNSEEVTAPLMEESEVF